jgi:hypothetical protein
MATCYYMVRQPEQGDAIVKDLLQRSAEWLSWIDTIVPSRRSGSFYTQHDWMQTMEHALAVAEQYQRTGLLHQYIKLYEHFIKQD